MISETRDRRGRCVLSTLGETCPQCKRRDALVVLADPRGDLACEFCDYVDEAVRG